MPTATEINSATMGDAARFVEFAALHGGLHALAPAPRDAGTVTLISRRRERGRRELPARITLAVDAGVPGDAWSTEPDRNPDAQIAVMQSAVAALIANGQPLELSGDQLYLDLDLSVDNLPIGSRLQLGAAVVEVTPKPHNGCQKFRARFGDDALRFVCDPATRHRNLRGIYLHVITPGEITVGCAVTVLARA